MSKIHKKLVILDKIKLNQKLNTNFACFYSEDQRVSILSETGVYIFQLGCDSENRTPSFSFIKSFYSLPQYSEGEKVYTINERVGININNFIGSLDQYQLYEALLDVNISQNVGEAKPAQTVPISAQWSPKGIDDGQFCLLGVLTNLGVLELVGRKVNAWGANEYYCVCNLSEYCLNLFKGSFKSASVLKACDEQLAELKVRVDKVRITGFTWGEGIRQSSCYLFCGHGDGGISVWSIGRDLVPVHECYYNSRLKQISAMAWINGGHSGLLITGDQYGRINALILNKTDGILNFKETIIYSDSDGIRIEYIKQFSYNDLMYIIIVKGTFVIIAVFNAECNLLDQKVFSCGNLAITAVEHYEDSTILIMTYTGIIIQLQLLCETNKLQIERTEVSNDVNWKKYRGHGLFLSYNKVFVGLVVHPAHMKDFAKTNQFLTIVILMNRSKNPIKLLLNNNTGSLEYYWDCLETLRTFGLKHKVYPCEKYPFILKLNYDTLSVLETKTLLHISKITRVIYSRKVKDVNRNIESVTVLGVIMQIKLAIKRLKQLIQLHCKGENLTEFQLNSMEIADTYLREIILGKNLKKFDLTTKTVDEIYDVMAYIRNMQFPHLPKCFWCENSISGFVCFPPHTDTRCAISFMQITDPVCYKCFFCKSTVHRTVVEEEREVQCPFCDLLLQKTFFKDKLQGREYSERTDDLCAEDCLKEEIDANCVEAGLDSFGYTPKSYFNFDEISISDASSADNSDVEYIFDKELLKNVVSGKDIDSMSMEVD